MRRVVLNRQLTLETSQRVADGAGGFEETWVALGTLWAEISARTGRETGGEGGSLSATAFRIIVRAAQYGSPSRPVAGQRFRDGPRIFNITAVAERGNDGRFLTCFAEEEVAL